MNPQIYWFLARSSGIVTWALVSAAVLWGLVLSARVARYGPSPAWTLAVHRFLGGLSVVFLAVHLVTLALDDYVYFGWEELFVPMASTWRPEAVAWGIVALYLLVAVEVTSLLSSRLPRRLWRTVHMSSFVVFVLSTVHLFEAGTDVGHPALRYSAVGVSAAVGLLLALRMVLGRRGRRIDVDALVAAAGTAAAAPTPTPVGVAEAPPTPQPDPAPLPPDPAPVAAPVPAPLPAPLRIEPVPLPATTARELVLVGSSLPAVIEPEVPVEPTGPAELDGGPPPPLAVEAHTTASRWWLRGAPGDADDRTEPKVSCARSREVPTPG